MEPFESQKPNPTIPIAIIAGFAMIAAAIYFTGGRQEAPTPLPAAPPGTTLTGTPRAVDEGDYIRGNPNAPIVMIEYSDYECPFCKQYHTTLRQIMDEYGVTGKVAWVYRQFPITQLHPNAPTISEAALCVGSLGGSEAFWEFSDTIFEERDVEEFTNMVQLPDYAEETGVSRALFTSCLQSGQMKQAVEASAKEAFDIGARGTPYTVLLVGNQQAVINGAQSYDTVKSILDNLISQLDGVPTSAEDTSRATQ